MSQCLTYKNNLGCTGRGRNDTYELNITSYLIVRNVTTRVKYFDSFIYSYIIIIMIDNLSENSKRIHQRATMMDILTENSEKEYTKVSYRVLKARREKISLLSNSRC